MSATSAARFALDTIGRDLSRRLPRTESPINLISNSGNDEIKFYSAVPSSTPSGNDARGIALVVYRTKSDAGLARAAIGTSWSRQATPLLFADPTVSQIIPSPSDSDFDEASPLVFRLEISVLDKSGNILATASTVPETFRKTVSAVIVSVASLDGESRKKIPDVSVAMSKLAAEFSDAKNGAIPANDWLATLGSLQSLSQKTGIPLEVLASIKIAQRTYAIP